MWSLSRPSEQQLHAFLARQASAPFSYPEVGQSRHGAPPGYNLDHNRQQLGRGRDVFESACAALRRWQMFPAPLTSTHPADTPIEAGNVVAVLARAFGLWWLNAARVVYVVDEQAPVRRFGFAYGTLLDHVECGEERFTVEWGADDVVWYDLLAFSRPHYWMVRLGYPLARRLQRRFAAESKVAMSRACQVSAGEAMGRAP